MMVTTVLFGLSTLTVSILPTLPASSACRTKFPFLSLPLNNFATLPSPNKLTPRSCVICVATSTYLVSGSADNALKLWNVRTGQCLYTWEFPTAVKRVQWSEDDSRVLAVTEKRMGYPGGVSVFQINRDEPSQRSSTPSLSRSNSKDADGRQGLNRIERSAILDQT